MKVNAAQLKPQAERVSSLLKLLAHPERLMVLCHLHAGEHTAGELLENSQLSQSAFSQHLALLRKHQLVCTTRKSQSIVYRITSPEVQAILDTLCSLYKK